MSWAVLSLCSRINVKCSGWRLSSILTGAAVGYDYLFMRQEERENDAEWRFEAMVGSDAGIAE